MCIFGIAKTVDREAAVDTNCLAGYVCGGVHAEEGDEVGDVVHAADAARRGAVEDLGAISVVGQDLGGEGCLDVPAARCVLLVAMIEF